MWSYQIKVYFSKEGKPQMANQVSYTQFDFCTVIHSLQRERGRWGGEEYPAIIAYGA